MNTGVFTPLSAGRDDLAAVKGPTVERFPAKAASRSANTSGSTRLGSSDPRKPAMTPVLASPCGTSASRRSVQLMEISSAAHGTPAAREFHAAPPPYETPQPPIRRSATSGRSRSHAKTAFTSAISFGPSIPIRPPESPWPRASKARTAYRSPIPIPCATASPVARV